MNKKYVVIAGITVLLLAGGVFALTFRPSTNEQPDGDTASSPKEEPKVEPQISKVSLTSPRTKTVSGTFTITPTIDGAAEYVEIYVDNELREVTYTSPFRYELDTLALSNGEHTIKVIAYDANGTAIKSNELIITVFNLVAKEQQTVTGAAPQRSTNTHNPVTRSQSRSGTGASTSHGGGSTTPPTTPPSSTPDTTAPTVPTAMTLSASDSWTPEVSWAASSDDIAVTAYKIYRDGAQIGSTANTAFTDTGATAGNSYDYSVMAVDAAGNTSNETAEVGITLPSLSIWSPADTPANINDTDTGAIELGVKFRPKVSGKITGVRFFKGSMDTGTHTGNLWDTSGNNLRTAVFQSESASGWQQVTFSTPLDVVAGTTYVASYHTTSGHYSSSLNYFTSAGFDSGYIEALQTGVDGPNAVYKYSATSSYPGNSGSGTNYWVDVAFVPDDGVVTPTRVTVGSPSAYQGYPDASTTGITPGRVLADHPRPLVIRAQYANTVVENLNISGDIDIYADNAVIKNSKITATDSYWGIFQRDPASGLQVTNSIVTAVPGQGPNNGGQDYGIANGSGGTFTATANNISNFSSGISTGHGTIKNNYVHDIQAFVNTTANWQHTNGFISGGNDSAGLLVEHNTFINETDIAEGASAGIGLFADNGPVLNSTITDNWIAGGAYALYPGGPTGTSNVKITNNKFSTIVWPNSGYYGATNTLYWYAPGIGNEWSGNVWADGPNAGQTITAQ